MGDRIAYHVPVQLDPCVGQHALLGLLDAHTDNGTPYAIGCEHAPERDCAHKACRAEETVLGRAADGGPERVRMLARRRS